jgi:arabinogalactan endo-1,4-beta-galactosidase
VFCLLDPLCAAILILGLLIASLRPASAQSFIMGADLSLLKYTEDHGVQYKGDGQVRDALAIFKEHGFNYVRLRLFVHPDGTAGQVNTLAYTVAEARRVKAAGLHFLLDLHYSDGWADPGHQAMPAQWKGLNHVQLTDQVFTYTRDTLMTFQQARCLPDMVAVGNEITSGMLWPDGGPISEAKWGPFTDLLKAGIRGVHAADPSGTIKIMIHIDRGSHLSVSQWFFDHLEARNVPFDVIGLSYYPGLNGPLKGLSKNLDFLARTYHKDIVVAETDYNWRGGEQKKQPYPLTPEGQKSFLEALIQTVEAAPDGHGKGIFYWAPEWIEGAKWSSPGLSGEWENRALFDDSGMMLPAMNAFRDIVAQP